MAVALVQLKASAEVAEATTIATTFDSSVTAGNQIIVNTGAWDNGVDQTISSIADNKGNGNYTVAVSPAIIDSETKCAQYYKNNIGTGGTTFTVTVSWSASINGVAGLFEYSGLKTGGTVTTNSSSGSSAEASSGAVAPAALSLYVAGMSYNVGGATTMAVKAGSVYTQALEIDEDNNAQAMNIASYTGSGSQTCLWTIGASRTWVAWQASYEILRTVGVTGTATASITEADVVTGGKTVILTLTGDTYVSDTVVPPVIEAADCTVSGTNTPGDPWLVSTPAAALGDLLIFYLAWDDSTATTAVTAPAGKNSETLTAINATPVTDGSTETRAKAWYTVTTAAWVAGTLSFDPNATESWSATVVRVPAGEFDASTPIGATSTSAATTTSDTTVDSPAFSAGATDGNGTLLWFAGVDTDPLSATPPTGWGILQRQDLGDVAHGVAARTAAVTNSESITSQTWSIAGDSWTSIAVIVRKPTQSFFAAQRSAIATGLDSGQSEALGWDAKVKVNIPVANVVRTSATVCTITLQAQSDYNITAQETITATVPAAALTAGSVAVVGTPTVTVDTGTGPISGTLAATLGAMTAAAAVTVATAATLALTLGAATASGAATVAGVGTAAITLADATLSATGGMEPISGTVAVTLDPATVSGTATVAGVGSVAVTLGAATASGAATVAGVGTAAITLGAATVSSAVTVAGVGTVAVTLDAATVSSASTTAIAATVAQTLDAATVSATGEVAPAGAISGTVAVTLDAATLGATGTAATSATASITLDAATASGSGTGAIAATVASLLGSVLTSASATVAGVGEAAITLSALTTSATATVGAAGTLAATLGPVTLTATGTVVNDITGTLDVTLSALTLAGTALIYTPTITVDETWGVDARSDQWVTPITEVTWTVPAREDVWTVPASEGPLWVAPARDDTFD